VRPQKGDVELPSDIVGIVWESFDEHGAWKQKLAKELEVAGFAIDRRSGDPFTPLPLVAAGGARASYRFFEFFTAQIRNPNTRGAYALAAKEFTYFSRGLQSCNVTS
jgi:hypothetical protein